MELAARSIARGWGGCAMIGVYCMTALEGKTNIIPSSLTKALKIGSILSAQNKTMQQLQAATEGRVITEGQVKFVSKSVEEGFLRGKIHILSSTNKPYEIILKNEYLVASCHQHIEAETPDIICLLAADKYFPILSDKIACGQNVLLFTCPGDSFWYTPKGLALVGVQAQNLIDMPARAKRNS